MNNLKSRLKHLEKGSNKANQICLIKNAPMKTVNGMYPDPDVRTSNGWRIISYKEGQDISHLLEG